MECTGQVVDMHVRDVLGVKTWNLHGMDVIMHVIACLVFRSV